MLHLSRQEGPPFVDIDGCMTHKIKSSWISTLAAAPCYTKAVKTNNETTKIIIMSLDWFGLKIRFADAWNFYGGSLLFVSCCASPKFDGNFYISNLKNLFSFLSNGAFSGMMTIGGGGEEVLKWRRGKQLPSLWRLEWSRVDPQLLFLL